MTLVIIIITVLVSISAFRSPELMERLLLSPYRVIRHKEWYRLLSHIFVHADYIHLAVNMFVLFSFGASVETIFKDLRLMGAMGNPWVHYGTLYFGGAIIATLTTIKKHKDHIGYRSVGASGAVSAVVFSHIFFYPLSKLYFFGIIPIPGVIFGAGYLIYSHYSSRRASDNINHDAHFGGAIFGLLYPLLVNPKFIKFFISGLTSY